jgi:hypothetical protein
LTVPASYAIVDSNLEISHPVVSREALHWRLRVSRPLIDWRTVEVGHVWGTDTLILAAKHGEMFIAAEDSWE